MAPVAKISLSTIDRMLRVVRGRNLFELDVS
jgi:hypothetical protein